MSFSSHIAIAIVLAGGALALAIPVVLDAGSVRPVPVEKLTVTADAARPPLVTADRAIGPVVQGQSGMPDGNPFVIREKGVRANLPVPEPPPPPLALPEPPPTPFAPGR